MKKIKSFILFSLIIFCSNAVLLAQQAGSLSGQVYDSLGAVIIGATVTLVDSKGKATPVITNKQGEFTFAKLAPGKYTVRASATNFTVYENTEVLITEGNKEELIIALDVSGGVTDVEVGGQGEVSTDPNDNIQQKLTEEQIKDLPDDPDELAAYLQAMAGGAAGPDGAQISVDGFSNGQLPPKEAIREIRFNQNPFSAEYDRIGFGRIEILTKPGFDKFRGGVNFNFNDESLNSRNPFAPNRAPSQTRNFGGNYSGPIKAKKSSFFVNFGYNQNDNSNLIKASILDGANNIVSFDQDVTVPSRRVNFSPRIDYAINDKNTLQGRYSYNLNTSENQGVGGISLPSRATTSRSTGHELQLTESMIINSRTVNETRFEFSYDNRTQNGDNSLPTINVSNAFTGGGAQSGFNYTKSKQWELQNYTTTSVGKNSEHSLKFGIRLRGTNIDSRSESGYGGTFNFFGFLDDNGTPLDQTDDIFVSSIDQYRQKVLGNPDPRYNPNQFSITAGNPLASVSQIDYGIFVTDDWRARKDLTLSFGLRYENQTNVKDNMNIAPRLGFAWSPGAGGARQPKTVVRGGFGIFFERFSENNTLRALRNDGVTQLSYTVTNNPAILGQAIFTNSGVANIPTIDQLTPRASIPYRIDPDLQVPYSLQSVLSVERQLPWKTTASVTFITSRALHNLRIRNINAPVCPSGFTCPTASADIQLLRPDPTQGNIFQYESSGYSNTKQLVFNFSNRLSNRFTLFGNYILSYSSGISDSISSPRGGGGSSVGFPAYSYDQSSEFASSAFNTRHTFFVGGSIGLPFGFRMSPTIIWNSSRPFNIVTGIDSNRDSLTLERPTYTELNNACVARNLTSSYCDITGIANPDTTIIPRNYGVAPASFNVNMNLSKSFGFGGKKAAVGQNDQGGGNRGGGGGGGRGGRGGGGGPQVVMMGGGGGMFGGGDGGRSPYNLTIGMNVRNLFNTVNLGSPQGSLTSPFFGQSIGTGGGFGFFGGGGGSANRRVDLSMRFSW